MFDNSKSGQKVEHKVVLYNFFKNLLKKKLLWFLFGWLREQNALKDIEISNLKLEDRRDGRDLPKKSFLSTRVPHHGYYQVFHGMLGDVLKDNFVRFVVTGQQEPHKSSQIEGSDGSKSNG